MFTKSFPLFSILGFRISIDLSWFFLAALVIWSLATNYFPEVLPGLTVQDYYLTAVFAAAGMFASIVYHELAHALVARYYDIKIAGITLFIFGGVAELEDEPPTAKSEFLVAIAGPISSVVLAFALWGLAELLLDSASIQVLALLGYLSLINMVLAIFNLIPAFPLDGGRMLRAGLWWWQGDLRSATRIASVLGAVLGIALMVYGAYNSYQGSTIGGLWQILIGYFIYNAAGGARRQTEIMEALRGVSVRQLMRPAPAGVPGQIKVDELIAHTDARAGDILFPVMQDGRPIGLVLLSELQKIPADRRAGMSLSEAVRPLEADETVGADRSAIAALRQLGRTRGNQAFVLSDGKISGWISARDIFAYIHRGNAMRGSEGGQTVG
ncbi:MULTISPECIES: site-2 protease family protein [Rhodomicrobium]|uniref:site-2 protease family protein n=1 Tax=Rhodomicrobium TaxID=1068 RepID=UPI000B4A6FD5|nr:MULTISPECIES: site-2 protease family protein [Rhodomicrobium]